MDDVGNNAQVTIPWERLSKEALLGVIDAHIVSGGTDISHLHVSLDEKRNAVMNRLRAGEAEIRFDAETQTCSLALDD